MENKNIKTILEDLIKVNLKDLFIKELNRFEEYSITLDNLLFDYSKNYINKDLIDLFIKEANKLHFSDKVKEMFNGKQVNFTEKRAVLHVALRNKNIAPVVVDNKDYYSEIWETFNRFTTFAEDIRYGNKKSSTNDKFTDVVNIGIGGSYLPVLANYEALYDYKDPNINVHFVSNVDSISLKRVLSKINIKSTLFVVASKTFTTPETILNAITAKKYLIEQLGIEAVEQHFVAISTNIEEAKKFGINSENIFGFWDFIGGRFSTWSAAALPLVIAIGKSNFLEFLDGAQIVDTHFKETPLENNIPFIMAIISIIYRNFMFTTSEAIIPYCDALSKFPLYLQQVVMESNGKTINTVGNMVNYKTSPVIFGEVGTNAQHSFFQLIHQGSDIIPVDFLGFVKTPGVLKEHQDMLVANLIAQSEALMLGKSLESVQAESNSNEEKNIVPHKLFKGNRPSNMFFFKKLNPKAMGMLCALYEHKVFSLGIMWKINSFDQFGVELGKKLAKDILLEIQNKKVITHDNSTSALVNYYKNNF